MNQIANELSRHKNIQTIWILRQKDITLEIADELGIEYRIISKSSKGLIGNFWELILNIFKAIHYTHKYKIDVWLTKYGAGNMAARICGRTSISFNDDDIDIVPFIAYTSYPFANAILAPQWTRMGIFSKKCIRYESTNELIYLHKKRFTPSQLSQLFNTSNKIKPYIVIRLSALSAHHDIGIRGIQNDILLKIINQFSSDFKVIISSEKALAADLEKYCYQFKVSQMHSILYHAKCLITDSLSMALEAAITGTPTVRISDFGENLSAFQEMKKYNLITNFPPDKQFESKILEKICDILKNCENDTKQDLTRNLYESMVDPLPYYIKAITMGKIN